MTVLGVLSKILVPYAQIIRMRYGRLGACCFHRVGFVPGYLWLREHDPDRVAVYLWCFGHAYCGCYYFVAGGR